MCVSMCLCVCLRVYVRVYLCVSVYMRVCVSVSLNHRHKMLQRFAALCERTDLSTSIHPFLRLSFYSATFVLNHGICYLFRFVLTDSVVFFATFLFLFPSYRAMKASD